MLPLVTVPRPGRPPSPRGGPRERRDKAARREELLDAATTAIREVGAQATMAELAAAAGITKPILYSHFGDKAGLAHALAQRVVGQLNEALLAGLAAGVDSRARMRATIEAFVDFVQREPQLYSFLVRDAIEPGAGFGDPGLLSEIGNQITLVLGTALRAAGRDHGPAELWSYGIIGAVFITAEWWMARPVLSRDQLVDDLCRLLWDGLGSTGLDDVPVAAVEHDIATALGRPLP
jgi:AcrR family transcriptional regulator